MPAKGYILAIDEGTTGQRDFFFKAVILSSDCLTTLPQV